MRQKTVTRLVVWAIVACILLAIYFYRREGFAELAPATYLSWSGTKWEIVDNANRTRGIESTPGGLVIVDNVVAVQVVGKTHILSKDSSGKLYVIKVDEWGDDEVRTFATEPEWLDVLKSIGVTVPDLHNPASLYKSSR